MNTAPNSINEQCLNILKRKASEKAENGEKLVCSVMFDEMSIRKHVQWSHSDYKLMGYLQTETNSGETQDVLNAPKIANQALVFVVRGVNDPIQLPIAYYFIGTLKAPEKRSIVKEILESIVDCNVIVSSITFDGFQANKTMCHLFGANLHIYSTQFKPYFSIKGQKIFIFFDACHMIKLVRSKLAAKEFLIDDRGDEISWKYFIELVRMEDRGLARTHKLTRSHIAFANRKMNVELAVQTLSESTAVAIDFMRNKGYTEFEGSEATTKFTRIMC